MYRYQRRRSPTPEVHWNEWLQDSIVGDRMDEDYSSPHSSADPYPTTTPGFTEYSNPDLSDYTLPFVSDDTPGLIPGSAPSSVGSPRSPRSPRSNSPEGSPEREFPHTMADFTSNSAGLDQGWAVDPYYGTDSATGFDSSGYAFPAGVQAPYLPIQNGYPATVEYQTSPSSSDSGYYSPDGPDAQSASNSPPRSPPKSSSTSSHAHSRSSHGTHKKGTRTLQNVDKINQVRMIGGCIVCRIGKYSCDEKGPCAKCEKVGGIFAQSCCIRQLPSEIIGSEQLWGPPSRRTPRSAQQAEFINVYLAGIDHNNAVTFQSHALQIGVQQNESIRDLCIWPETNLSEDVLVRWAESQIEWENQYDFQRLIGALVMQYKKSNVRTSRDALVKRVHTLNCMFRIWKSEMVMDNAARLSNNVHFQLQNVARDFIKRAQHDIMKEFDKSVKDIKAKDRDLGLWACLWQTIFIYMNLMEYQSAILGGSTTQDHVVDKTRKLVIALMTLLSMHFRNQSPVIALQTSESEAKRCCNGDSQVLNILRRVVEARSEFHAKVAEECQLGSFWAPYWKQLIVLTEKDLDRRRKRKGSSK